MSQFDSLLDFNDTPAGNGTSQKADPFDPFGTSSSVDIKGSSDTDLLGDFGFSGQSSVKTNGQSVNPLYEFSMDQDFSASESNNLIMSDDIQVSQKSTKSANPLYDLENEDSSHEPSANPLYDLNSETNGHSVDLLSTGTSGVTDDSGVTMETEMSNEGVIIITTDETSQEVQFDERIDESHESVNGISDEDSELVEKFISINPEEVQEMLQNQNNMFESNVTSEQVDVSFDDQNNELDVQVCEQGQEYQIEEEDQQVDVREEVDQEVVTETQEVVGDTQTEEEVVVYTEETTVPDVPVYTEETTLYTEETTAPAEDIFNVNANTETVDVITEEVVIEEQEVIPSEKFHVRRKSSSSSDEEKDTEVSKADREKSQVTKGSGTATTVQSGVVENGLDEGVFRETGDRDEISFDQMSSIRNKLESNKSDEVVTERKKSVHEEIADAEGGEYENEPVHNPDVVREGDKDIGAELPEVGTARNILEKFKQIETTPKTYKREATPPEMRKTGKVEYVSEPKPGIEVEPQKVEGGIFENQPAVEEDVVHSYDAQEEALPEKGYAKNILEKFKQIQTDKSDSTSSQRRELTPDRNAKFEYVSEPRAVMEKYEGRVESGIFESQPQEELPDIIRSGMHSEEVLPEKGTAKSLASRYKEISEKSASPQVSERKRELTPDKTGKVEYVSEPRTRLEQYEGKSEAGVFESRPEDKEEIVKSDMQIEEILPEKGVAKSLAAKFREIESSTTPSPTSSPKPRFKEVTPPRDDIDGKTVAGVLESTPTHRDDIVRASDPRDHVEEMPERGMAKNLASKFKQYEQSSSVSPTSRGKKEFTPPRDKGVYENTPKPSLQVDVRQAESGILESTPSTRDDVARESTYSTGDVEFPEEGYAKNMVSRWKQLESQSGKSTPSPKVKEFTPPRDFPMSPKSPAGFDSSVQPGDLPGQYQEQGKPGVFENQPSHLEGVAREADTDVSEGLPEKDAAKSLVQKFKAIQEQAKKSEETPKPVSRKDSSDSSNSPVASSTKMFESSTESPKGSFVAVQLEKCAACQKTVYAMEKLEMNKNIYHRACFKCSHCKCVLTAKTFSMNEGVIYCTNHFKQLFARKGNYDEGFGRQQYKKKWGVGDTNDEEQ